ncbi:MAG: response regulator [Candidatus Omnitrophota bacterium]
MPKPKILIVDDEPDIRDILKITLADDYKVLEAANGQDALIIVKSNTPDLILLDYKMPGMTGIEICKLIKTDILLQHLPIIMLTGKGEVSDKVTGINAGADDYIVKPFVPEELLARIRMVLRRTERDLDANALTRLPGNLSINNELQKNIEKAKHNANYKFAVCYLDLDKFKSFNDKYGFERGDEIIKETARILIRALKESEHPDDFIGHIGGDDFIIVTEPQRAEELAKRIINDFDKVAPSFYNEEDRKVGFIVSTDRQGREQKFPILSISIGIVTNETRKLEHIAQIGEIEAELKKYLKSLSGSNFAKDKRK